MKKITSIICAALCAGSMLLFPACTEANNVNWNLSQKAEYFEVERRITVYNARTDKIIMYAEGYMNIANDEYNELIVTVKTGPEKYKKNYIYLNEYTMYVVEDITGTHAEPFHYVLYFHGDWMPEFEEQEKED